MGLAKTIIRHGLIGLLVKCNVYSLPGVPPLHTRSETSRSQRKPGRLASIIYSFVTLVCAKTNATRACSLEIVAAQADATCSKSRGDESSYDTRMFWFSQGQCHQLKKYHGRPESKLLYTMKLLVTRASLLGARSY